MEANITKQGETDMNADQLRSIIAAVQEQQANYEKCQKLFNEKNAERLAFQREWSEAREQVRKEWAKNPDGLCDFSHVDDEYQELDHQLNEEWDILKDDLVVAKECLKAAEIRLDNALGESED